MYSKMDLAINHYHIMCLLSNESERVLRNIGNLANNEKSLE
jgi:hypothetical protein